MGAPVGRRCVGAMLAGLAAAACGGSDHPDCAANEVVVEVGEDDRVVRGEVIVYSISPRDVAFHADEVTVRLTFEEPLAAGGSVPANASVSFSDENGLSSCSDPPDHGGTLSASDSADGYTFAAGDLAGQGLFNCFNTTEMVGCARFMDQDRDRVTDSFDECPDEREDADGFEDEDGCLDPDNDQDGIDDDADRCPYEPGPAPDGCPA